MLLKFIDQMNWKSENYKKITFEKNMNTNYQVEIPLDKIKSFCKKWQISELALFGSVLRSDFDQKNSDIDVLITFIPGHSWGWEIVTMKEELEIIFNRSIDLVTKKAIENSRNPYRKKEILESYQVVYEEAA